MHAKGLTICLTALLAVAQASWIRRGEPEVEVATWTKAGARYRSREVTYTPETVTVTEASTTSPTRTFHLRSAPTERQVKRAFLGNWSYKGCIADDEDLPALVSPFPYQLDVKDVSGASCSHYCDTRGDTLAALQNGNECWCGKPSTSLTYVDDAFCSVSCVAAPGEKCGGKENLGIWVKA